MPNQSNANQEELLDLTAEHKDPLIRFLNRIVRLGLRVISALLVAVVLWGIADILYISYERVCSPPYGLLKIDEIFQTFGAFLGILIAIEIYTNVTLYLTKGVLHMKLVVETALIAMARKIIVLDYKEIDYEYVLGTAAVVLALGIAYWLITKNGPPTHTSGIVP